MNKLKEVQKQQQPLVFRVIMVSILWGLCLLVPVIFFKESYKLLFAHETAIILHANTRIIPIIIGWPLLCYIAIKSITAIVPSLDFVRADLFVARHATNNVIAMLGAIIIFPFIYATYLENNGLYRCSEYEGNPIYGKQTWLKNSEYCIDGISHVSYDLEQWMIEKQNAKQSITLEMLIAEKDRLQQDYDALFKQD